MIPRCSNRSAAQISSGTIGIGAAHEARESPARRSRDERPSRSPARRAAEQQPLQPPKRSPREPRRRRPDEEERGNQQVARSNRPPTRPPRTRRSSSARPHVRRGAPRARPKVALISVLPSAATATSRNTSRSRCEPAVEPDPPQERGASDRLQRVAAAMIAALQRGMPGRGVDGEAPAAAIAGHRRDPRRTERDERDAGRWPDGLAIPPSASNDSPKRAVAT